MASSVITGKASTGRKMAARVVDAFRAGQSASGQRLVEADYARRWSVGRSTVREAFRRFVAPAIMLIRL